MSDIRLDGDTAVVGGVHSDSHNVQNNYTTNSSSNTTNNSTVNNNTVYEAQKTQMEIMQDNESQFLQAVIDAFGDGILDQKELASLNLLAQKWQIAPARANAIIQQVRQNSTMQKGIQGNEYLASQILQEVFDAIQTNKQGILQNKFRTMRQVALTSSDPNMHFYYHLLLASLYPENCTVEFINSRTDNYWQLYWTHIAYIKLGGIDNAAALLPRLGGFGCPQGDVALLMAIDNISEYRRSGKLEYYRQQALQHLDRACQAGMSEPLSALWYAAKEMLNEKQQPEEWFRFYCEVTLKELAPVRIPSMPKAAPKIAVPPLPKFNAQSVNLPQMQGFNPLQAARNMGLGQQMPKGFAGQMPQTPPPMPSFSKSTPTPEAVQLASEVRTPEEQIEEPDPLEDHYGIILTDSDELAMKYGCSVDEVYEILTRFYETAKEQQMYWYVLDVSPLRDAYGLDISWMKVNEAISDYIEEHQLQEGPDLHLFILGGNDVIPIPEVEDPYEYGSSMIPTDMPYCFHDTYLIDFLDGSSSDLDINDARNSVARLPLEDGDMLTDIESDLGAYFNISGLYGGGIPVGNVVMESNADWIPASTTMSQHLPLLFSTEDPELVRNGMYISPKLLTSDEDAVNIYRTSLDKADMLMFNLHGSDSPEYSGFYSSDEAFNLTLLRDSNARVFNTVACFGARYTGYERNQSMLLSALYGGGILLYTGSLISVPMYYDRETDEARQLLLNPGTGSEVFMRLYALYQFKGMTAGKALLQTKCDYFNMCRHVESDGFSLSTAMMFCLYGNPMLHVRRRKHVIESALQNDAIPPAPVKSAKIPLRKASRVRLMEKSEKGSMLSEIRGVVDGNLAAMRTIVERNVYDQLGIPPRLLSSIDRISRPADNGEVTTYSYNYHNPDSVFAADIFVEVDDKGRTKRIYTTK